MLVENGSVRIWVFPLSLSEATKQDDTPRGKTLRSSVGVSSMVNSHRSS